MTTTLTKNTDRRTSTPFIIYGLFDPRDHRIRYIGQSARGLKRTREHKNLRSLQANTHKNSWIKELLSLGLEYRAVVLEVLPSRDLLDTAEIHWIKEMRLLHDDLTNLLDGGSGVPSEYISKSKKRYWDLHPEKKIELKLKLTGRKISKEMKEEIRKSSQGKTGSKNKYGFIGIRDEKGKKFFARIKVDGKRIGSRMFDTIEEAAREYNRMALEYFGVGATLNSI